MRDRPPVRFRGYDVLAKRNTVSWDEVTREVVRTRLAAAPPGRFFSLSEWRTVDAMAETLIPQSDRAPDERIPITPFVDDALSNNEGKGYRFEGMPPLQQTWRLGIAGIDAESDARFGRRFEELAEAERIALLTAVQQGDVQHPSWRNIPAERFFAAALEKIVSVYYAHPRAWNEIGFGGPASPRGYVRLGVNQRDPWEAEELSTAPRSDE